MAHSLRLVLPRMMAPAARSRATTGASRWVILPASASDPAVVGIGSAVSILSFIRIGMPCSGPRTWPGLAFRIQRRGLGQRVGIEGDDTAQGRPGPVDGRNSVQIGLDQLHRSHPAGRHVGLQGSYALFRHVVGQSCRRHHTHQKNNCPEKPPHGRQTRSFMCGRNIELRCAEPGRGFYWPRRLWDEGVCDRLGSCLRCF